MGAASGVNIVANSCAHVGADDFGSAGGLAGATGTGDDVSVAVGDGFSVAIADGLAVGDADGFGLAGLALGLALAAGVFGDGLAVGEAGVAWAIAGCMNSDCGL